MAFDIGMAGQDDDSHLRYAAERQAILVRRDKPFAGRTMLQTGHAGLICWTGAQDDFGGMIRVLANFSETKSPEETANQVFWLKV